MGMLDSAYLEAIVDVDSKMLLCSHVERWVSDAGMPSSM